MPARQKPSKKRTVLNMGTLMEKATVSPNTSMKNTEMISTGWRPNLMEEEEEGVDVTKQLSFWRFSRSPPTRPRVQLKESP